MVTLASGRISSGKSALADSAFSSPAIRCISSAAAGSLTISLQDRQEVFSRGGITAWARIGCTRSGRPVTRGGLSGSQGSMSAPSAADAADAAQHAARQLPPR